MRETPDPRDVALGAAVTGARAATAAARVALLPLRLAARTPVFGSAMQRAGDALAREGQTSRARARAEGERAARRLADETLTPERVERVVGEGLEHEATRRAVQTALASPGLERIVMDVGESDLAAEVTERVVASKEVERAVEQVASSHAVRAAFARQTTSLADDMVGGLRQRAIGADDAVQRTTRRWLGRPAPSAAAQASFGGFMSRAVAFLIDLPIAHLIALVGAALLGLVVALVGELRPTWFAGVLVAGGWLLVVSVYLVTFWTITGQTPGMSILRLRVVDARGQPPGLGRSFVRLVVFLVSIVPLFAGFLPILVDERRRGLHDLVAGTVVVSTDAARATEEVGVPAEVTSTTASATR